MATNHQTTIDDDDDDLDSLLDGVLDDFSKPTPASAPALAAPHDLASSSSAAPTVSDDLDDDFAKQLAAGMEELVSEMEGNDEFKQTFEKIWRSFDEQNILGDAKPSGLKAGPSVDASSSSKGRSFQETIAQTMSKLKDSSEQVDTQITEGSADDMLAEMMKQMEALADSGDFTNVLEGMMEQLMSKDLLYEPMKDLAGKYPQWLADNKGKVAAEDYSRYEKQYEYVRQIMGKYEEPGFDDKNEAQAKEIVELMQQMQECGSPPAAILEELAPGMEIGEDGMPKSPDEQCRIM